MARKSTIPAYCHHKASGQAYVTLRDASGARRVVYLGVFGTRESKDAYSRLIAELAADPTAVKITVVPTGLKLTVNELFNNYWKYAETHYPPGSKHLGNITRAMQSVRKLYEHTLAEKFGPLALKTVREEYKKPSIRRNGTARPQMSRYTVNRLTDNIKRIFKWAASEQLVPVAVYQALTTASARDIPRYANRGRFFL